MIETEVEVELFAPPSYWGLAAPDKSRICNGCGPGAWKVDLVPDCPLGMKFEEACNIHDYSYHIGRVLTDKESADRAFLNNMLRIIDATTTTIIEMGEGRALAYVYYEAVKRFGGPAFWQGKNAIFEMQAVKVTIA